MEQRQVKIGPEFFAKAKNDYSDWQWAIIREFMQNSIDAPRSTRIEVQLQREGEDTRLVVENNGAAMSEDVLLNKLLVLGGSGKSFADGAVGGFGKAKEILYFAHKHYRIESGNLIVEGSGADYTLTRTAEPLRGTRSSVLIAGAEMARLYDNLRNYAAKAQWGGELWVTAGTGERTRLATNQIKGRPVRQFSWGKVYVSKADSNTLLVRIGGIPMFYRYTPVDRLVILELEGASDKILQSSRDALRSGPGWELDALLSELAIDKHSALKDRSQVVYKVWDGPGVSAAEAAAAQDAYVALRHDIVSGTGGPAPSPSSPISLAGTASAGQVGEASAEPGDSTNPLGFRFVVKTTGKRPPKGYGSPAEFNDNAKHLVAAWSKVLIKLWRLFGGQGQFNVGFTFDDNAVATYETDPQHGLPLFLINPLKGGKDNAKWVLSPNRRWELVAVAGHEFTHHQGFKHHDEDFTTYYTRVIEPVLLRYREEFDECFEHAARSLRKETADV